MKYKLMLLIGLISLMIVIAGCNQSGKAFAGQAISLAEKKCEFPFYYDWGNGDVTGPYTTCTNANDNKEWCALITEKYGLYGSGGQEGVDWKRCDLDRRGNPVTDGCYSEKWVYDWGNGKMTREEGCTLSNDNQYWCMIDSPRNAEKVKVYVSGSGGEDVGYSYKNCDTGSNVQIVGSLEEAFTATASLTGTACETEGELHQEAGQFTTHVCSEGKWLSLQNFGVGDVKVADVPATLSSYSQLRVACLSYYPEGCDKQFFDDMFMHSKMVASDFGVYYYVKTKELNEVSQIDVKNPKSVADTLYKNIDQEGAELIVSAMLVEAVEKKKANQNVLEQSMTKNNLGVDASAAVDSNNLLDGNGNVISKNSKEFGLQMMMQMIDQGKLSQDVLGLLNKKKSQGSGGDGEGGEGGKGGGSSGSSSLGGDLSESALASAVGGEGCMLHQGGQGGSGAKAASGLGGSGGGAGNPGAAMQSDMGSGTSTGKKGKGTGLKTGGGGGATEGGTVKSGGSKKPKEGFAGDPADEQSQEKGDAPCQAVNWGGMLGGGETSAGVQMYSKDVSPSSGGSYHITVIIKNGEKTTSVIGTDKNGKSVDIEKKEPAKTDEGKSDKVYVPLPGGGDAKVDKKIDTSNKDSANKDKDKKEDKDTAEKKEDKSSKPQEGKGALDPNAEVGKTVNPYQKCQASAQASMTDCLLASLEGDFASPSDSLSDCDVKGMPSEEGGSCQKGGGESSAAGFDLAQFFNGNFGATDDNPNE